MIATRLADVAAAVGARLPDGPDGPDGPDNFDGVPVTVTAVTVDSRTAGPGALFVAVVGERTDGHDHARAAVEAGAVAVLATRALSVGVPVLVVPDAVTALSSLATAVLAARRALPAPFHVLALTGSSGKTSTKDLLATVLAAGGEEVVAPPGSYNNELGVPLTVLSTTTTTRHLVLEMGARGPGHIAWLTSVARPDVGAVLNVGSAHLGGFGSRAAIAAAKGELVEALPDAAHGGVAVLFADDGAVAAMAGRTRAAVVTAGRSTASAVQALDVRLSDGRASFTLVDARDGDAAGAGTGAGPGHGPRSAEVGLRLVGEHHVDNAVVAAAMALAVGEPLERVAAALGASGPASPHRMAVTERPDGVTVVDDAYNANPESVRAALRALTALRGPAKQRRTWAVLGEMLELGADRVAEHDRVGRYAVRLDVSRLVVVGQGARPLHLGAVMEGSWGEESAWVPDADAALALLAAQIAPGDVVLVKGSNSTRLHELADALAAGAAPAAPATTEGGAA